MHDGLSYLERRYNDGENFILHYVTARELYNLVKAAKAGRQGDPEEYRDYLVKPPVYRFQPRDRASRTRPAGSRRPDLSRVTEDRPRNNFTVCRLSRERK